MSCMNSSQYNGAYSLDFMEFVGIPQGFPVTINRYKLIKGYPNLATIVTRGSEGVKEHFCKCLLSSLCRRKTKLPNRVLASVHLKGPHFSEA